MKTNVKILLKVYDEEMLCEVLPMMSTSINLKELLHKNKKEPILFEKKHDNLQTLFDLTDVEPSWLLVFDENKEFVTVKPHFRQSKAKFQMLITEPYVLIIPENRKFRFDRVLSFIIDEEKNEKERIEAQRKIVEEKLRIDEKKQFFSSKKRLVIYKELYALYSDEELVDCFNAKTNIKTFNRLLSGMRVLIHGEFVRRGMNVDSITSNVEGCTAISSKEEIMLVNRNGVERIVIRKEELKRVEARKFEHNITFVSEREMKVVFSSLIINVESIERLYPGGYKSFYLDDDFYGATNGYIFIASEMMTIPTYLYSIIDNVLHPMGFEQGKDYVIGLDENTHDSDRDALADRPIPWCKDEDWIHSIIAMDHGNLVWHANFDKEKSEFMDNIKKEKPLAQNWNFWYNKHPLLRELKLKSVKETKPFILDEHRYERVDDKVFITKENGSIPLLLGTQFGVYPNPEIFPIDYTGHVAILAKSLLSGHVAGLGVYYIEEQNIGEKLFFIKNDEIPNEDLNERYTGLKIKDIIQVCLS